ncbi:AAA family ATPase [Microbacterium sp. 2216-1]|uniref:AAA family ATPase n=1 Tax=Microbacterium sp. 2216-1 TaxID=3390053 RepID=UPI003974C1B0
MRLHRLEVAGFGPFRARQVVDFDEYADDGIFLIAGRTGAGKSSILDAVCFGLYGGVPRYDSGDKRMRSDHCAPDDVTEVVVEFSTTAGRYRVTRSPAYERPARRGGGMTTQQASVLLEQLVGDEWVGRAARAVDAGNELNEILQLSQEQFLQVILLAQNRFADFLLAGSNERQALLRRLFDTGRFSDYQARFDERRRAAEQALSGRRAAVDARLDEAERIVGDADLWGDDADHIADSTDQRIERLRRAITRADYRVERATAENAAAEKAQADAAAVVTALTEQRRAQSDRDRARAALAALEAQNAEIAEAATRRDRARAADNLRALITAEARGAAALEQAACDEAEAIASARATDAIRVVLEHTPSSSDDGEGSASEASPEGTAGATQRSDASAAALRDFASERTRESGAWQNAAEHEAEGERRRSERVTAEEAVTAASAALEAIDAERDALPAQISALETQRDDARREGARAETAVQAVAAAERRRDGAAQVARLTGAITEAERTETEATEAHARAQHELGLLRRRRLDGYAGELAAGLVAGEPCAVCGSTAHPAPAEHADPLSPDDIAAAEAARDTAAAAERTASRVLAGYRAELAAAAERAAGRSLEQAEHEITQMVAERDAAARAAERADELSAQLQILTRNAAEVDERRTEAAERLGAARTALSLIDQRIADADRMIAEARGDYDSVAARIAQAQHHIALATRAADAIEVRIERASAAAIARGELDAALTASVFDDVAQAEHALLAAAEIATLDARVTAHAVEVKKEKALLLDLEMRALPEEPIDLAPAEAAAHAARESWQSAVDADSQARGVQRGLTASVESAASEHAASAADAEQFEVLRGLADALAGRSGNTLKMNLETFVLAAELEEIVAAANLRLHDMSDGRYQLRHSDALAARGAASGLGIVVFDAFTGHSRPAKSLSGGETFLSSLALALGLAEVVTARAGGIRLDTLFIDEGFGSLDADTLETAMRTLDALRQGGRTVGVISHVEAMQEQIPAQLTVRTTPDGPSVIEGRGGR